MQPRNAVIPIVVALFSTSVVIDVSNANASTPISFAFGMFTRLKVRDRWMPLVALAAPALSALVQWWALKTWDYQIGFELLIYNAAFTMFGMLLLVKRHEK